MTGFWFGFISALVIAYLWYRGHQNAEYKQKRDEEFEQKFGIKPEND